MSTQSCPVTRGYSTLSVLVILGRKGNCRTVWAEILVTVRSGREGRLSLVTNAQFIEKEEGGQSVKGHTQGEYGRAEVAVAKGGMKGGEGNVDRM